MSYFGLALIFQIFGVITNKNFSKCFWNGFDIITKLFTFKSLFIYFAYLLLIISYSISILGVMSNTIMIILNILGLFAYFYIGYFYLKGIENIKSE